MSDSGSHDPIAAVSTVLCDCSSVVDGHELSPASSQPSLQHNGSAPHVANIAMSLPSVPDGDLRVDGTAKFPLTTAVIPPKKPLTPYMKFSKSVSVCVVAVVITCIMQFNAYICNLAVMAVFIILLIN